MSRRAARAWGRVPVILALAAAGCAGTAPSNEPVAGELILTVAPALPEATATWPVAPADRYPSGTRVVAVAPDGGGAPRVLSDGLDAAGGVAVAPAGDAILFAGRAEADGRWAIYEVAGDSRPRRLHDLDVDCFDPAYLAHGAVVFVCAPPEPGASWALFVSDRSGGTLEQISFDATSAFDPTALEDGRILFARLRPGAPGQPAVSDLFTVNPEGSLLEAFGDSHALPARRMRPREDSQGNVLFLRAGTEGGAQLLRTARNRLSEEPAWPHEAAAGSLAVLSAEPDADGAVLVVTGDGRTTSVHRVFSDRSVTLEPEINDGLVIEAVPRILSAAPRGRPRTIDLTRDTGLLVAYAAGRSDGIVGPPQGSPEPHSVRFEVSRAGRTPFPRSMAAPTALGAAAAAGGADVTEVLGDGSFFAELPADLPVRVTTLDADGNAIATSAWFWVRPGEARGCFGCHEGHAAAPVNRRVEAIAVPPVRVLTGVGAVATDQPGGAGEVSR